MMKRLLLLGFVLVCSARQAMAAEGGEENLFAGDLGNMVWTVVIFVAVLIVLGKFAWGPLLSSLQERERFIHDSLAQAKDDREAAEARLKEYTDKLDEARAEATEIVTEGRRDAEVVKQRIEEEARAEADRVIERARREIEIAKQTAIKELYTTSAHLATDMAARVVKKEIGPQDHERLIAEALEELGDLDAN